MTKETRPKIDIFKVISNDAACWGDEARNLTCPECGDTYSHMEPPYLKDSEDNYNANWGGRGDLAVVPVWGECGSKWEVCIGFHKGESAIFARLKESCKK
jgi:hypothetical protein